MTAVRDQGRQARGEILSTPGNGDCLFHAVAEAAEFPDLEVITAAYRAGCMEDLRHNDHVMAFVESSHLLDDTQLYHALRQCYVLQMRHDVSRELQQEHYAAFADHV